MRAKSRPALNKAPRRRSSRHALLVGAVVSIRTSLREGALFPALLFVFPLLYLLYFSQQRVMIVRNLMLTLPLLAAGAALGLQWIVEVAHSRRSTWLVGAALLVVFGVNQVWQLQAGLSIPRHRRWNGAIAASDFPSDKPVWASRSFIEQGSLAVVAGPLAFEQAGDRHWR